MKKALRLTIFFSLSAYLHCLPLATSYYNSSGRANITPVRFLDQCNEPLMGPDSRVTFILLLEEEASMKWAMPSVVR